MSFSEDMVVLCTADGSKVWPHIMKDSERKIECLLRGVISTLQLHDSNKDSGSM